jgi:hypothetical protein
MSLLRGKSGSVSKSMPLPSGRHRSTSTRSGTGVKRVRASASVDATAVVNPSRAINSASVRREISSSSTISACGMAASLVGMLAASPQIPFRSAPFATP